MLRSLPGNGMGVTEYGLSALFVTETKETEERLSAMLQSSILKCNRMRRLIKLEDSLHNG